MSLFSRTEPSPPAESSLESTVHHSIRDVDEGQLNNLVEQSDRGSLFHRYGWLEAVEDSFEYEPRHVLASKDGNPVGFLPNVVRDLPLPDAIERRIGDALPLRVVEPPPPGYGGPVVVGDERESLDTVFDASDLADGPDTLFHSVQTHGVEHVRYTRYLHSMGYRPRIEKCVLVVDLRDGWDAVRENMNKERRKAIRSATDQDHEVQVTSLGDGLERTYEAYVANMERVGGEILPRTFLEAIDERIPERVRVFRALVDGDEVGRYVHLLDDERSVLHHWLSAIPDESNFEYYPSELLHRRAIQWGIERGYDRYCFGPTNPHFDDSVFRFKEKYGGSAVPSLQWERGSLPLLWQLYDAGRSWYLRSTVDAE